MLKFKITEYDPFLGRWYTWIESFSSIAEAYAAIEYFGSVIEVPNASAPLQNLSR